MHTCYAPVRRSPAECCHSPLPLDLHVLSLSLAFILSQDQTLHDKKSLLFLFFLSRFNSRPSLDGSRSLVRLFHFNMFKNSSLYLPASPFFNGESGRKDNTIYSYLPNLFHYFFRTFFQPPRSTPPGPFHLATPPESGCKDKATLSPFPNFLSHFLQEKIKREAIILRMNRLKKKKLTRFHARGKSRIDRFE